MKADAVLLCSGFSERFGENKLLMDLGGKALYRHILDTAKDCGIFENIFIVSQYDEILENASGCVPLRNTKSREGISASVKLGAENSDSDLIMYFAGDQPLLAKETILDFYEKFIESGKGMGFVKYDEAYGIPAVFSEKYKSEILMLSGDKGAKSISKTHLEDVFLYEIKNPLEVMDCDTREDKKKIERINASAK